MNKKNPEIMIMAFICFGLIMIVLWVYWSTAFGEKTPEPKRNISVVLYNAGENGWESLEEGIRQAEDDFNVKINFVVARRNFSVEDQINLLKGEVENGAQGILWAVMDATAIYQPEVNEGIAVPIITLESNCEAGNFTYISAENYAMGKALAEALLEDFADDEASEIVVMDQYAERDSVRLRMKGFYDALGDAMNVTTVRKEQVEVELPLFMSNRLNYLKADAVVAFNKESLQALCDIAPQIMENIKVYGVGNTPSIVAALGKGRVEKLVFQNEFNIGYLGVKSLLAQMDGLRPDVEKIEYYCIGGDELHEIRYERLLFPIVE